MFLINSLYDIALIYGGALLHSTFNCHFLLYIQQFSTQGGQGNKQAQDDIFMQAYKISLHEVVRNKIMLADSCKDISNVA